MQRSDLYCYFAICSACQMRSGVAGMSSCVPSGSASRIALITAGGAAVVPASPVPFHAERIGPAGNGMMRDRHWRHQIRARHGVVHERAGHELAAGIVDRVLGERLAETLRDAAMDLRLDDV